MKIETTDIIDIDEIQKKESTLNVQTPEISVTQKPIQEIQENKLPNEQININEVSIENNKSKIEQELINTIKMEPIIEKNTIEEEKIIIKKEKMMKITDIILITLIILLVIGFIIALILIN